MVSLQKETGGIFEMALVPDLPDMMAETHRIVTYENRGLIESISVLTNYPYQTIHSRITGRVQGFDEKTLDILRAAHFLTRSPVLESFVLWPGLHAIDVVGEPEKDLEGDFNDVFVSAGKTLNSIRLALSDGMISKQELKEIKKDLANLEKELCDVRAHVQEFENYNNNNLRAVR